MKRFALTGLHAFFLFFLSLLWMNTSFVYEDEYYFTRIVSTAKHLFISSEDPSQQGRFLFINIAYEKQLIPKYDEQTGQLLGNEAITDRKVLGALVDKLSHSSGKPKMVVLDVFLDVKTHEDSLLIRSGKALGKKIITVSNMQNDTLIKPVLDIEYGLASYDVLEEGLLGVSSDAFFKYQPIYPNGEKSLALKMFEQLNGAHMKSGCVMNQENGSYVFKTIIIDHPIRWYNLFLTDPDKRFAVMYANEFLQLPDELITEFVRNKLVYIGDMEKDDLHETIYGDVPGPAILANQYLSLENRQQEFSLWWALYLISCFWILSYNTFYGEIPLVKKMKFLIKWNKYLHLKKIHGFIMRLGVMAIISAISYFVFNISIGILFIPVYFQLILLAHTFIFWMNDLYLKKRNTNNI